jgi:glycosyltransferase 2 family protein
MPQQALVTAYPGRARPPGAGLPPHSAARSAVRWWRPAVAVAVLVALVWRLGTGPFVRALGDLDVAPLAAAVLIGMATTTCCAWRWTVVARAVGTRLSLRAAVAACYRSQFLNVTTPGGVAGDVLRGLSHGRDEGSSARGFRGVVWERSLGQAVQGGAAVLVLLVVPSPVPRPVAWAACAGMAAVLAGALVARRRVAEAGRVLTRATLRPAVVASALAVVGHVLTFVVAARAVGVHVPVLQLLPLSLVVLVAAALPTNLAGWGPREGVAAWVFGAAGLGADTGLATAVVFGVLALAASLPGAAVLAVGVAGRSGRG